MLSPWTRKIVIALLLAIIVGWWMPKVIHPPRVLPTPIKKFIDVYAPPHLDPGAQMVEEKKQPIELVHHEKNDVKEHQETKWAVQIGSYRNLTQIQSTINELKSQGYTVITHPVDMDGKPLFRIWVGELNSRSAAKSLSLELKDRFKLQGFVLKLGDI